MPPITATRIQNNNDTRFSSDKTECEETYFKCKNSRCIPGRWRCDYDNDCRDGSDEENCSWRNCTESEFKCRNGRCILQQFKCDGHNQCTDGSDESNCPSFKCNATEFSCVGSGYCIPRAWQCDGDVDCSDESDELNCNDIGKYFVMLFECAHLAAEMYSRYLTVFVVHAIELCCKQVLCTQCVAGRTSYQ